MGNPEMPQFNLAKAQKEALEMQKKVNGGAKDYNDAEKFAEADEREKKFKNAIPVENIIPNIKESVISTENQIKEATKRNDQSFPQDFWRNYVRQLLNNWMANDYLKERIGQNNFSFKDNTTDLLDKSDIVHGKMKGENGGLELFNNQIIVDLGAGRSPSGYFLSELLKAKAYVGVELWSGKPLKESIESIDSKTINHDETEKYYDLPDFRNHKIPFSVIEGDILSFLKRLPDNSVSITMSGIGMDVLGDQQYRGDVLREILRVLDPNGGFLTQWSGINEDDFEDLKIVSQSLPDMYDHKFIFKKKDEEIIEQERKENIELEDRGRLLIDELNSLNFNDLDIILDWMSKFVSVLRERSEARIDHKKIYFKFSKTKITSIFKKHGFKTGLFDLTSDIKVEDREKSAKDIINLGLYTFDELAYYDMSTFVTFFKTIEEWKNKFDVNHLKKEEKIEINS